MNVQEKLDNLRELCIQYGEQPIEGLDKNAFFSSVEEIATIKEDILDYVSLLEDNISVETLKRIKGGD